MVIILFLVFLWRGVHIALNARDVFGAYLAFGLVILLTIQAATNLGVVTGLLPTKGLNLPLVSGGGSSLLVTCAGIGILLNVSRYAESPGAWQPLVFDRKKRKSSPLRKKKAEKRPKKVEKKPISQRTSGVVPFVRGAK